ncbi:unannotated protein [freshwater metagenome]|uniref:Unannotated protein n=1 Tax=freshwater metagenome TaxID=449393 RepID=A0A6J7E1B7_9ZZZZ
MKRLGGAGQDLSDEGADGAADELRDEYWGINCSMAWRNIGSFLL